MKTHKERFLERWKDNLRAKAEMSVKENLESQRAWLGCYFLCAKYVMYFSLHFVSSSKDVASESIVLTLKKALPWAREDRT